MLIKNSILRFHVYEYINKILPKNMIIFKFSCYSVLLFHLVYQTLKKGTTFFKELMYQRNKQSKFDQNNVSSFAYNYFKNLLVYVSLIINQGLRFGFLINPI